MIRLDVRVTSAGLVVNQKKKLRATMRKAGAEVASVAKSMIRNSARSGRTYRGSSGSYTASSPGQPPANLSGTLVRSIAVRPFKSGEGVAVRARIFYALFLEKGAKGGGKSKRSRNRRGAPVTARVLLARPFLETALDSRASSISNRIRAAIVDDVQFVRIRA